MEQFLSVYMKLLGILTIFQNSLLSYSWVINQFANKTSAPYMMLWMFLWFLKVNQLKLWKICAYTIIKWRTLYLQNFVPFLQTSCIIQSTKPSYTVYVLSLTWALQLSWDVMANAAYLCHKAAVVWWVTKETFHTVQECYLCEWCVCVTVIWTFKKQWVVNRTGQNHYCCVLKQAIIFCTAVLWI